LFVEGSTKKEGHYYLKSKKKHSFPIPTTWAKGDADTTSPTGDGSDQKSINLRQVRTLQRNFAINLRQVRTLQRNFAIFLIKMPHNLFGIIPGNFHAATV